jgi:hypothetical protein
MRLAFNGIEASRLSREAKHTAGRRRRGGIFAV